jgi:hypothetical protein
VGLSDLMARMGHDSERAAIIYQHEAGASRAVAPWANGTSASYGRRRAVYRNQHKPLTCGFSGAGGGNRTRTISLGICLVTAVQVR